MCITTTMTMIASMPFYRTIIIHTIEIWYATLLYLKPHQCYKSHGNVATEWCLIKNVGKQVEISPRLTMWKKSFFQTNFSVKKGLTMDGMSNFKSTREQNHAWLDCVLFVILPTFSNYLIWIPLSKWQNTPFLVYSFLGKNQNIEVMKTWQICCRECNTCAWSSILQHRRS